jgi:acyl-CoA thioesterase FadM
MCLATQTLVLLDRENRRPTPVPGAYRSALAAFEGPGMVDARRS